MTSWFPRGEPPNLRDHAQLPDSDDKFVKNFQEQLQGIIPHSLNP
ncbi:hypothetical protein AB7310_02865 [Cylindrospermopsis raciborskii UAM/DH-BiRr]